MNSLKNWTVHVAVFQALLFIGVGPLRHSGAQTVAAATSTAHPTAPAVYDGAHSAKLTTVMPRWSGDTALDNRNSPLHVTPGQKLQISFQARSGSSLTSMLEKVTIATFSSRSGSSWLGDHDMLRQERVPPEWKRYALEFVVPEKAAQLTLAFRVRAGGRPPFSVLIDQVQVADRANGRELVTNGGFESWTGSGLLARPAAWRFFTVSGAQATLERTDQTTPLEFVRPVPLHWLSDVATALQTAVQRQRILLFTMAQGSDVAQHYDTVVFQSPDVRSVLQERFALVRLELPRDAAKATQVGIYRGGTVVLYSPGGQPQAKFDEPYTPVEFLDLLQR